MSANSRRMGLIRFGPILSEKIWGGRRLAELFGRDLPEGKRIGESWEISGLRQALSAVAEGPLLGADLYRLAGSRGEEIFGPPLAERCRRDFPLLAKFIDASDTLSVQVHPDDSHARAAGWPNGKSEAWYVVAAEPGACVYRGFEPGVGPDDLRSALEDADPQAVAGLLRRVEVEAGDAIDLPAGTVHAIGAGLLLYEVQQSSDVTYRVHDWGRMGLDGRPRPLHLDEAFEVMDFSAQSEDRLAGSDAPARGDVRRSVLRDGPPFHLELASAEGPGGVECPADRFEIIAVTRGAGRIEMADAGAATLRAGDSALVPASAEGYEVRGAPGEGAMEWVRAWAL